ncbi:unannotated protein [freshwater metagenome]|uniref:Unannotated protein n=1 Tax=freshwater metagenome TaxID=449393 RepID=A0A6J5ZPG5_9ZZZZ
MSPGHASEIASWKYEGPWAIYDGDGDDIITDEYWAVLSESGQLVGFYCTGDEARVSGLDAESGLLDVGIGMHPDLVGTGFGREFATAVMTHCRSHFQESRARAVVQAWNLRSLRLAEAMGFQPAGEHTIKQNRKPVTYTVLMLETA